jgi:hypothetical protein
MHVSALYFGCLNDRCFWTTDCADCFHIHDKILIAKSCSWFSWRSLWRLQQFRRNPLLFHQEPTASLLRIHKDHFLFSCGEVRLSPVGTSATIWPNQTRMMDYDERGAVGGMSNKENRKTFSSAALSTANPTWHDLGSKPGRRDGKPAINRLSNGTVQFL